MLEQKFSQRQGLKNIMLRHRVQSQQYKATQLCRDKKFMLMGETLLRQRKSLSRHKLRILIKIMSQHSRDFCNKVEELEEEISVKTKDNHVAT